MNSTITSKTDELELRLDELEKTVTVGFVITSDTLDKVGKCFDLQTAMTIVAFLVALVALCLAVWALKGGAI